MVLYNVFRLKKDNYGSPFLLEERSVGLARKKFASFSDGLQRQKFVETFPPELAQLMSRAVDPNPGVRPSLAEFKSNAWFNGSLVTGLYNLKEFYKLEQPKQKVYLKAFSKIVPKYSPRIVLERILPFLREQLLNPNNMLEGV